MEYEIYKKALPPIFLTETVLTFAVKFTHRWYILYKAEIVFP